MKKLKWKCWQYLLQSLLAPHDQWQGNVTRDYKVEPKHLATSNLKHTTRDIMMIIILMELVINLLLIWIKFRYVHCFSQSEFTPKQYATKNCQHVVCNTYRLQKAHVIWVDRSHQNYGDIAYDIFRQYTICIGSNIEKYLFLYEQTSCY